jgi:hypothetical protein
MGPPPETIWTKCFPPPTTRAGQGSPPRFSLLFASLFPALNPGSARQPPLALSTDKSDFTVGSRFSGRCPMPLPTRHRGRSPAHLQSSQSAKFSRATCPALGPSSPLNHAFQFEFHRAELWHGSLQIFNITRPWARRWGSPAFHAPSLGDRVSATGSTLGKSPLACPAQPPKPSCPAPPRVSKIRPRKG